ncbi:hypothetical protein [Streptomyces chumphonensis]|uniref:hypothetical protein n=1 Tax=Streptomyces chumphonensis TaxID=1214925 RepID=UPI003D709099
MTVTEAAGVGPVDYPPARALRRCYRCSELTTDAVRLGVVEAHAEPPCELYACPCCAAVTGHDVAQVEAGRTELGGAEE